VINVLIWEWIKGTTLVRKEKGEDSVERGDGSSRRNKTHRKTHRRDIHQAKKCDKPALELLQNGTRCCSPGLVEEGGVLAVAAASGASYCGSLASTQEVVVVVQEEEEEEEEMVR
jgi:hypothetical protein